MPFFRTCDILEFEVVGSRDTFSKLDLPEKSFQKEKFDYFKVWYYKNHENKIKLHNWEAKVVIFMQNMYLKSR